MMKDERLARQHEIYEAVMRLLRRERDIHAITVSQIAREAGIGKGTVYEYFQSKEELVQKAFLFAVEQELAGLGEAIRRTEGDFDEKLDILLDFLERNIQEGVTTMAMLFADIPNTPPPPLMPLPQPGKGECSIFEQARMTVDCLVEQGIREGRLQGERKYFRFVVFSALAGVAAHMGKLGIGSIDDGGPGLKAAAHRLIVSALSKG